MTTIEIPRFVPLPLPKPERQQNAAGRTTDAQILAKLDRPRTCKEIARILCTSASNMRLRMRVLQKAGEVTPCGLEARKNSCGIKPIVWRRS
jgi:Helix-turn-helix domain